MNLEEMKNSLGSFAKDIRLNLDSVLSPEGAMGLSRTQIWALALSCAYHTENRDLIESISLEANLPLEFIDACKSATVIMAMNNVYYRFLHLVEDDEFSKLPARLRMNVISKPGVDREDFELMCLAVSAMEGCGKCITSHVQELKKANVSREGIQSAIRIASVINAANKALTLR